MRFLTAVALALVMLWVPVDGVAQTGKTIGDWMVGEGRDPFNDTARFGAMALFGRSDAIGGIETFIIQCNYNRGMQIGVLHPTVRPDRDGRVSLTYRLGSSPAQTVLLKPRPTASGHWLTITQDGIETLTRLIQEVSAFIEDPRVAVRIQSPVDELIYQETWTNLRGTSEAWLQMMSDCGY